MAGHMGAHPWLPHAARRWDRSSAAWYVCIQQDRRSGLSRIGHSLMPSLPLPAAPRRMEHLRNCTAEYEPGRPQPEVVPFEIGEEEARAKFLDWQAGRARLGPCSLLPKGGPWRMRPALLPFWLFDVTAKVEYAGAVGFPDKWVEESGVGCLMGCLTRFECAGSMAGADKRRGMVPGVPAGGACRVPAGLNAVVLAKPAWLVQDSALCCCLAAQLLAGVAPACPTLPAEPAGGWCGRRAGGRSCRSVSTAGRRSRRCACMVGACRYGCWGWAGSAGQGWGVLAMGAARPLPCAAAFWYPLPVTHRRLLLTLLHHSPMSSLLPLPPGLRRRCQQHLGAEAPAAAASS